MARLTLGDQVSIVSTGEKGTIVGESNGLYDVRIGGAGTMETRRGVRRRDLERFVPEFSSPFNGMVQVNIPGVTGVPMSAAQQANFDDMLRASGAEIHTLSAEQLAAVERESARTWAEMEQNPDGALARENRAMAAQLAGASMLDPAETQEVCRAQQAKIQERIAKGRACARCGGPAASACGRCKSAYYCSRNCQKLDWSRHKVVCEVSRKSQKAGRTADARIVPEAAMPAPEAATPAVPPAAEDVRRRKQRQVFWSGAAVALAWWLLS